MNKHLRKGDNRTTFEKLQDAPDILDRQHLLQVFNISPRTLQRWRDEKILPYKKIRGKIFYTKENVLKMME